MTVNTTDTVPEWNYALAKDGPASVEWWLKGSNGVPEPRANSLHCLLTWKGGSLTKTTSTGITLAEVDGVANAYVILQLTPTEVAAMPLGRFTRFRFREGSGDATRTVFIGSIEFK